MRLLIGAADAKQIRVSGFEELPLPEDGMINGIITDAPKMTGFFERLLAARPEAAKSQTTLTIHTNSIQTKVMDVPRVPEAKALEIIRREFVQYDNFGAAEAEESIYDYTILNNKSASGGITLLAASVPADMLRTYRDVLEGAGLKLKSVGVGVGSQIKLMKFLPEYADGSFVLAQTDGRYLSLSLFTGGLFKVTNRYRLVNEIGTRERLMEIGSNLSSMLQFAISQRDEDTPPVETAVFAGLTDAEFSVVAQEYAYLSVELKKLDLSGAVQLSGRAAEAAAAGGFDPAFYLFNLGGLLKR
ncbi:MAG: hypothetical protein LBR00_00755 [Clostridiales Family XIII bacterium]|jgi:hypothetical protein|nr:hypothetical protein [Clostridiales Family XIII bacterium]